MYYYQSVKDDSAVVTALQSHINGHPSHGFPKTFSYLRRAGHVWNHKKVYRVYRKLNLHIKRKGKRRIAARVRQPLDHVEGMNINWSIDFMQDSLLSGRKFRTFNVIDDYNREALRIEIGNSFPSEHVIRILDQIIDYRGKPKRIRMDNGPEFISAVFEQWCLAHGIEACYIQPGKPMQNAFVERFNGTYRRDVLDAHVFYELDDVRALTEAWVHEYNHDRPHDALAGMSPVEYANKGKL